MVFSAAVGQNLFEVTPMFCGRHSNPSEHSATYRRIAVLLYWVLALVLVLQPYVLVLVLVLVGRGYRNGAEVCG